jgi:tetratricopeptide (TPR) repeat protein
MRTKQVLAFVVSSLLGLLLCELAVRGLNMVPEVHAIWSADEKSAYQRSANPVLNHELKPGFEREFPRGKASSNSHGFRDRERSLAKPEGVRRIALVGDSVVEGVNYVGDEDTISRKLELLYGDGGTEVLNIGVSGYCTLAEVELLQEKGVQFDLDDVVLVFTSNDFENLVPDHTTEPAIVERPEWSKHLFVRSKLFRLLCLRLNWFQFGERHDPVLANRSAVGENNVVDALPRLRELANAHGFRLLIAVWPAFEDDGIKDFTDDNAGPLLIERLARMNGIPVVRLSPGFRAAQAELPVPTNPREYFTVEGDTMHPTPAAAVIAATALKQTLPDLPPPPYLAGPEDAGAIAEARRIGGQQTSDESGDEVERRYSALRYQARAEDSEDYIVKIARERPGHLFAQAIAGRLLVDGGDLENGIVHLRQALELKPEGAEIRIQLVTALLGLKQTALADQAAAAGVLLANPDPERHVGLAQFHLKAQQWNYARTNLQAALILSPQHPLAIRLINELEENARREKIRAALRGNR